MLIPRDEFVGIIGRLPERTNRLLQVGAHQAEEHELWLGLGFKQIDYVEPIPHLAEMLKERFILQKQVKIWPYIITTFSGETQFFLDSPTYISGLKSLTVETKLNNPQFIEDRLMVLPCMTLSKLLSQLNSEPEMIVIDVQGAEREVLESGLSDIRSPLIVVELLYAQLYEDQTNAEVIKRMLRDLGYIIRVEYFDESRFWSDAIFMRSDLLDE